MSRSATRRRNSASVAALARRPLTIYDIGISVGSVERLALPRFLPSRGRVISVVNCKSLERGFLTHRRHFAHQPVPPIDNSSEHTQIRKPKSSASRLNNGTSSNVTLSLPSSWMTISSPTCVATLSTSLRVPSSNARNAKALTSILSSVPTPAVKLLSFL